MKYSALFMLLLATACHTTPVQKVESKAEYKKRVLETVMHCLMHVKIPESYEFAQNIGPRDTIMKKIFTDSDSFVDFAERLYVRSGDTVVLRKIHPSERRVFVLNKQVYYFVLDIGSRRVYGTYISGQKQPFRLFEIISYKKR